MNRDEYEKMRASAKANGNLDIFDRGIDSLRASKNGSPDPDKIAKAQASLAGFEAVLAEMGPIGARPSPLGQQSLEKTIPAFPSHAEDGLAKLGGKLRNSHQEIQTPTVKTGRQFGR